MRQYIELQSDAINAVTQRFHATDDSIYQRFGQRGREACREDLAFHLEFLRPVLEFGLVQPMVEYLCWLNGVLTTRMVPSEHLATSLEWLAEFFSDNMLAEDGAIVAQAIQAARTRFLAEREHHSILGAPSQTEAWPQAGVFEEALLSGDHRQALAIVQECIAEGASLADTERLLIQPALYRIGERWQDNRASVAQEHLATATAQSVMTAGLLLSTPATPNNKRILLACAEGNHHTLGLRMVADAFVLTGWDVQYMGANLPTAALLQQVSLWNPHVVALSVSFPQHLRSVRAVIARLHEQFGDARPAVIVGGLAINRYSELARLLGADATASHAQAAVDCAHHLLVDNKP